MAAARSAVQFMEGMNKSKDIKGNAPMKLTVEDKDVIVTIKMVGKSKTRLFSSMPKLFKKEKKAGEKETTDDTYKVPVSQDWIAANYNYKLSLKPEPPPCRQAHTNSNPSPGQLKNNHNNDDEDPGYEKVPEEEDMNTPGNLDSFEAEVKETYINIPGKKAQTSSTTIALRGQAIPKSIGGTDDLTDIYGDRVGVTYAHTIKETPSTASSASTHSYIELLEARPIPVSGVMFIPNDGEPAWITVKDAKGRDVLFSANLPEQGSHI